MQFSGQFITGIGSWGSGFCNLLWKRCSNNGHRLWASGEHTMLSSKLHLQSGLRWYVAVKKWTGYQTSGHSDPRKQLHLVLERVFPERNIIDRISTRVKDAYSGSQKEFLIQFAERFLLGYHGWIFNWIVRLIRVLGRIFPWVCWRNSHSGF